jgi:predicted phage terminase large subunit-like protein
VGKVLTQIEDDPYIDHERLSDKEIEEYEKLLSLESAYQNFRDFIAQTMPTYDFNWHHELIIKILQSLTTTSNRRIMIFVPPRFGKSELVSRRFPAWLLGRKPDTRIMGCSYSSGLATMFSRDVQRIMETNTYNEIFPDSVLPGTEQAKLLPDHNKYKRTNTYFEVVGHSGYLVSVGVGGSITGMGADLLVIDDPVKNEEEALSETYREKVFGWYNSTAYTRLEKGANVIICQTRWHKEDLSGKLISEMEFGGDTWEIINLPAIATEIRSIHDPRKTGEPLWPNKYDLDRMDKIKKQVGSRVWSSLYQQNPIIEGGNIIKENWIQYYTVLPFDITNWRECYLVQSWDLTFKSTGKSWVVGVTMAKKGADYYLISMYRKKADFAQTLKAIPEMAERFPTCKAVLVEEKANGSAIISMLKKKVANLIPIQANVSKDERLHAVAPVFEAGNFHLPANYPGNKEIVDELVSFPNGGTDDIVDAISQAILRFMEMKGLRHLIGITRW